MLPGMMGMTMAGMAFGGAFAAGVAFGAASVGAACVARRMMRDRTNWRDDLGPSTSAEPPSTGPLPGDDEPRAQPPAI